MDPTYDRDAVNPFLGRLSENPSAFFHGEPLNPGTLREEDKNYYFHATTLGNLPGILEDGLDPERGGRGGAGENIAAPVDPEMGEQFVQHSQGYVHFTDDPGIATQYAFEYETQADGYTRYNTRSSAERADIQRAAVYLRFDQDKLDEASVETDSDESEGAFKTAERIAPEDLQFLTQDGWIPLDDEAVRDEMRQNINQALGFDCEPEGLPEEDFGETAAEDRVPTSFDEVAQEENPNREYGTTPPERSIGSRSRGLDSF